MFSFQGCSNLKRPAIFFAFDLLRMRIVVVSWLDDCFGSGERKLGKEKQPSIVRSIISITTWWYKKETNHQWPNKQRINKTNLPPRPTSQGRESYSGVKSLTVHRTSREEIGAQSSHWIWPVTRGSIQKGGIGAPMTALDAWNKMADHRPVKHKAPSARNSVPASWRAQATWPTQDLVKQCET